MVCDDFLEEQGITFEGGLVIDFLALTSGGDSGGGNWDYAGYTYLGTNFDLDTLAGLPGLSFYVEAGWSFGEDLSARLAPYSRRRKLSPVAPCVLAECICSRMWPMTNSP